jgi:hypothetical protein
VGLFLLRVTVLVEIGDAANRGLGRRRDLDQVQAAAFGHADRFAGAQDADLAAVDVDYPDFRDANLVVHPYRRLARGRGTKISTNKSPPSASQPTCR